MRNGEILNINPAETTQEEGPKTLAEHLSETRINYLSAKQRRDDLLKIRHTFTNKEARDQADQEYTKADYEYRDARAEYIGTDVERFLEEQEKLVEAQLPAGSEKGWVGKAYDNYKKLGEYNFIEEGAKLFGKDFKAKGRMAKMVNARTAISLGLLGLGVGLGAGSAVGAAAIAGKRVFAGMGSAVGSYDIAMIGKDKLNVRSIEKNLADPNLDSIDTGDILTKMQVRNALDGKSLEDLKKDALYQRVLEKYKETLNKQIAVENTAIDSTEGVKDTKNRLAEMERMGQIDDPYYKVSKTGLENFRSSQISLLLDHNLKVAEGDLLKNQWTEKFVRKTIAGGAGLLGLAVGSGTLARLFGNKTELGQEAAAVETPIEKPPIFNGSDIELKPQPLDLGSEPLGHIDDITKNLPTPSENVESAPWVEAAKPKISLGTEEVGKIEDINQNFAGQEVLTKETEGTISTDSVSAAVAKTSPESGPLTIEVTSRGIEGTLLDLKKSNPEQYDKMIEWLKQQPYNEGVEDPGKLVHRHMLNYAQDHGMTIDEVGKDLSRIFKGEILINADGSIALDESQIKFMPEKVAAAVESPSAPAPETLEPALGGERVAEIDSITETFPSSEEPLLETPSNPITGTFPKEDMSVSAARELAAQTVEKSSDALGLILEADSKRFLKETFKLTPGNFDKIGNRSITQFLSDYQGGSIFFRGKYTGLFEAMSEELRKQGSNKTIRQFVLTAAKNYKELK